MWVLNVENSVERVERFARFPQHLVPVSTEMPDFLLYFGVTPLNEYDFSSPEGGYAFTFLMMSLTVSRRCWSFFMSRSMVFRE